MLNYLQNKIMGHRAQAGSRQSIESTPNRLTPQQRIRIQKLEKSVRRSETATASKTPPPVPGELDTRNKFCLSGWVGRRRSISLSQLLLVFLAGVCPLAAADVSRPNIVVILTDDVGIGAITCYGADPNHVQTPHIDRLAKEGRRFTAAYSASSVCSPSRYAMLTGRYLWRTGFVSGVFSTLAPLKIEVTRATVPSMLKELGYSTAAVGKWHLGLGDRPETDYTEPLTPGPLNLGFDYDFLVPANHGDLSGVYIENDRVVGLRSKNHVPAGKTTYGAKMFLGLDAPQRKDSEVMQVLTDKAVQWLGQQNAQKPFFLYYAPVAVHQPITPSAKNKGKSGIGPYGDYIMDLDDSVGAILAELERLGLDQKTLVLFTSDNGGVSESLIKSRKKEFKANGDLRGKKATIYEGGLRVPYLVRWPGRVPAGTVSDQMVNGVDTLATLAAIMGTNISSDKGRAEDSVNVLEAWIGEPTAPIRQTMIINNHDGTFAVRRGPWKWVEGNPHAQASEEHHTSLLFNLEQDPSESKNLIAEHPNLVKELAHWLDLSRGKAKGP